MRTVSRGITVHSGLRVHPAGPILFEIYRDASQFLHLRLEILKKTHPIPILLYRRDGEHKKLMLDGELELPLAGLSEGAYEVRSPAGEIFRFMLD